MGKYHVPKSCNYCGGENKTTPTGTIEGFMSECITVCQDCGKKDYWAHGYFESSAEIEGKCDTYG